MTNVSIAPPAVSLRAVAAGGATWNAFGIVQFALQYAATPASMMAQGMTAVQIEVYAALPGWMTAAFAVAVFVGTAGCVMLALGRSASLPLLALSLAAFVLLCIGDIAFGVFAAFGAPTIAVVGFSTALMFIVTLWACRARAMGRLA
ncbi:MULTISPECIES: hypothetical protein [unclassified Sphingopyxis]|uniref:hypothetical protein n=1 Tax=unclassified Sphingopyxis TaxID=2614943 RepID=UPI0028659C9A|nr:MULTISPECIES: hypothetical protein [unclassified Sphingopyxis]MDR6834653.1 hypothetical protein [Sphingopyxis sp. BE122]MDR7226923.1 hypothetical protein [Sphingopyxis sp. BE259]